MFLYICFMKQEIKSELTQQLIIDKAFNLFYKNGFKSTSIDKIMLATKLSKGAFYHHFKNKQDIGLAVISQRVQTRILNGMIKPLDSNQEPIELLKHVFTSKIRSFSMEEKQAGCPANNLINEIGDSELGYQLALRKIIDDWKQAIIKVIENGKSTGSIKPEVDSAAVAIYLISAFEGIRGIRKLYQDDQILEEYLLGVENYLNQLK